MYIHLEALHTHDVSEQHIRIQRKTYMYEHIYTRHVCVYTYLGIADTRRFREYICMHREYSRVNICTHTMRVLILIWGGYD